MQHHDIKRLPNGNILMLVVEKKTYAEAIAAGFNPNKFQPDISQKGYMLPDCVVEMVAGIVGAIIGALIGYQIYVGFLVPQFDWFSQNDTNYTIGLIVVVLVCALIGGYLAFAILRFFVAFFLAAMNFSSRAAICLRPR
jgi:uncharacterized membrane protein YeaQ/YmgE (transglycosylase-associated protein family)